MINQKLEVSDIKVNVPKFINNEMCTLFSDAVKLRNLLFKNIKNKVITELDFTGV